MLSLSFSLKGAKTGKDNGYTMLLDIESFDYKFFNEGSEGLKVALVHHLDMPIMRQIGFHISPGTENQLAVTPTLISTSEVGPHKGDRLARNALPTLPVSWHSTPWSDSRRNSATATASTRYLSSTCPRATDTGWLCIVKARRVKVV